ncbi:hypothetical protein [Nitritalea halalkaliphila]|uniref:hypothetical protein n=1 Tax=Nitritalea halalkaliphila TaxID=590849 RepID=UPI0002ED26D5|nr:hypothetical protein [Nitritalea halalkaliphila]
MEAPLTDQELNALISLLDDEDREVKDHVRGRLLALGADLIPYLENQWESSFNPSIQKELEELIHDLQFAQLKNRLHDWAASERRDLLEGLWLVNTYLYPRVSAWSS